MTEIPEQKREDSSESDKDFISSKLSVETTFPFLDVSSLTEEDKIDLEAKLRLDTKNIKKYFCGHSKVSAATRDTSR